MATEKINTSGLKVQPVVVERFEQYSAPEWAQGCDKCQAGVVWALPLSGALPLFEERALRLATGGMEVCTCRAGHMLRQYLRRKYNEMDEGYRARLRVFLDSADGVAEAPTVHWTEEKEYA